MSDFKVFSIGVGGLLVGVAAGYFIAEQRLRKEYADIADAEIDSIREHYGKQREAGESFNHPEEDIHEARLKESGVVTVEKASDLVDKDDYATIVYNEYFPEEGDKEEVKEEVKKASAKPNPKIMLDDFELSDYDKRAQAANQPYVIHVEEFAAEEEGYSQSTVTYFPDDDILLDENDDILQEIEMYVGYHNVERFGERSGDKNIVYIRNPRIEHEYEMLLETEQSYEEYIYRNANYKRGK